MNQYKFRSFTTEKGVYPTTFYCFDLCDCTPYKSRALYTYIDHSEDDQFDDDDEQIEIQIPNRLALYDLIKDINEAINEVIIGYTHANNPSAPLDDATSSIHVAIDIISELKSFDEN